MDALRAGFVRVAACSPLVSLGDPAANAAATVELAGRAAREGAALAVFPELGVTGYSLDDLFLQNTLVQAAAEAVADVAAATRDLPVGIVLGAPLPVGSRLYNCALVVAGGRIRGAVPKSYLPAYREFYEPRQFASGVGLVGEARLGKDTFPVGPGLLFDFEFTAAAGAGFTLGLEICEDLWVPLSPGAEAALAGAEVVANPSSSPITVAKARERGLLVAAQSAKAICGYVYAASGFGESSTDLAWDGQTLVFERGEALASGPRFSLGPVLTLADIDLAVIRQDRIRQGTFGDNQVAGRIVHRRVAVPLAALPADRAARAATGAGSEGSAPRLIRPGARFPFVPSDPSRLDQDCYEAYNIQVSALRRRLDAIGSPKVVIGLSGGLDSSHALIVAAKAMDLAGRDPAEVLAFSLPGFATSEGTKTSAAALASALGVCFETIDIRPAAELMLKQIGHPFADGRPVYDITFENVQAGLRTDYLFRIANQRGGIVLGTGDLSELALGWCTYGVGDQMSHYGVNAGVPKTLIQHLIAWVADSSQFADPVPEVLRGVLAQEISPELVPPGPDGRLQSTEQLIGPYPLHDFVLFLTLRFGLDPDQVFFRLRAAWESAPGGDGYAAGELAHWLEVFYQRFFASQFKRSALPNGPKVMRGGSLSPRGDWRQPSDVTGRLWLERAGAIRRRFGPPGPGQP